MSAGLPPIDTSLIPPAVRKAGAGAVSKYETALSFESMLDEQLAQSLTQTLQDTASAGDDGGDGSDGSSDGSTALTLQMLPQSLAQGLVSAGGLGLANQLYTAMGGAASGASTAASGSDS